MHCYGISHVRLLQYDKRFEPKNIRWYYLVGDIMKVLITIKDLIDVETTELLREEGIEIVEVDRKYFSNNQQSNEFEETNMIIGGEELKTINFAQFPKLNLIQTVSAGYDYLDTGMILQNSIQLSNASGIYSVPIAEWVVGQILLTFKRFNHFYELQNQHLWEPDYGLRELNEKKVLIFGTGSIGSEICKRLNVFNCEVDGVNSNGRLIKGFNNCFSLKSSPTYINDYDVLVFALPSHIETINFLNVSTLKKVSDQCVIINVGRGDLINEEDLLAVLKDKQQVMVFLDVHKTEPLPKDNPLWKHPRVFVTPHTSFSSTKNKERLRNLVVSNILGVKNNDAIINEVLLGGKNAI